jgi:hypothetical protein
MADSNVLVETRKLTKIYRDFWGLQKKTALRALNIEIRREQARTFGVSETRILTMLRNAYSQNYLYLIKKPDAELFYAGDEILAIAADTEEHLADALQAVKVDYEVLDSFVKEEDGLKTFLKAGHPPTLFAAFLYFDFTFAIWVLNGAMAPFIGEAFHLALSPALAHCAGQNFSTFKEALSAVAVEVLGRIGGEMRRLLADPGHIDGVLREGAERAEAIALPVLREVKDITGLLRP